jgi:hypothetical protein
LYFIEFLLNLFFDTCNGLEVVYLAPFFLACSALEYRFKILNDRLKTAFSCEMSSLLKEVVPKGSKQTLFHIIKLYDELTDGLDLFNSVFTISVSFLIFIETVKVFQISISVYLFLWILFDYQCSDLLLNFALCCHKRQIQRWSGPSFHHLFDNSNNFDFINRSFYDQKSWVFDGTNKAHFKIGEQNAGHTLWGWFAWYCQTILSENFISR